MGKGESLEATRQYMATRSFSENGRLKVTPSGAGYQDLASGGAGWVDGVISTIIATVSTDIHLVAVNMGLALDEYEMSVIQDTVTVATVVTGATGIDYKTELLPVPIIVTAGSNLGALQRSGGGATLGAKIYYYESL